MKALLVDLVTNDTGCVNGTVKTPEHPHVSLRVAVYTLHTTLTPDQSSLKTHKSRDALGEIANVVYATAKETLDRAEPVNLVLRKRPIEVEHLHNSNRPVELIKNRCNHVVLMLLAPNYVIDVILEIDILRPVVLFSLLFNLCFIFSDDGKTTFFGGDSP
jgi:hypothetical protein